MKRLLLVLTIAVLALPATALAKGPSEAKITGPGLATAIKISGEETEGSPVMDLADAAGFFPGAFDQIPSPMTASAPKGNLGPRYSIEYTVPGPDGGTPDDPPGWLSVRDSVLGHVHEARAGDLRHEDAWRMVHGLQAEGDPRLARPAEVRGRGDVEQLELGRVLLDRKAGRASSSCCSSSAARSFSCAAAPEKPRPRRH